MVAQNIHIIRVREKPLKPLSEEDVIVYKNVSLLNVDFNEKNPVKLKLQKEQRKLQVDETYLLAKSTIDKLISNAEFETVRNIVLYIQQDKDFTKFIKNKYQSNLNWNSKLGNQLQAIDITDLDIDNEKQINARLKVKNFPCTPSKI